jgi:hypothetical protein
MKKQFFQEATKAEIKKKEQVEIAKLSDIAKLMPDEYAIVQPLVPEDYDTARKFMKHGAEVKTTRVYTLAQAIELGKTPLQLREEAFDSVKSHEYCSYSFIPLGKDRRKRKVSLVECLEGARIFAYSHQVPGTEIKVKAYADARRVRKDGAEVIVNVPSREKDEGRMEFKLMSVPFIDNPEKYAIANNFGSDHSCGMKRFNIRYRYVDEKESSGVVNICCHEIAAYLQLVQQEWQQHKNIIPLQMCQFAIPSQATVDFYLKLENNVLVTDKETESGLRKPNRAEKEISLWALVESVGHDKTFYADKARDGNVLDYRWQISQT